MNLFLGLLVASSLSLQIRINSRKVRKSNPRLMGEKQDSEWREWVLGTLPPCVKNTSAEHALAIARLLQESVSASHESRIRHAVRLLNVSKAKQSGKS